MIKRISNIIFVIILLYTLFINSALAFDLKNINLTNYFKPKTIPEVTKNNPARMYGQLSKKNMDIGEPFKYTITLYQLDDAKVKLEKIGMKEGKAKFKNIKYNDFKQETEKVKNIKITRHIYYLQPKSIKDVEIPSFSAIVNGKKIVLPPVKLTPKSVLDPKKPMKDIHDIKPIEEYFIFHWEWMYIPLICLLFLIIIIVLIIYIVKNLPAKKKPEVVKSAHEIAYEKLNELKRMKLNTPEDLKLFYIILSEIMREYLEGRFSIQAIERTTEEITSDLKDISLNLKSRKMILSVLTESDLVKFAKFIPDNKQALDIIMMAYNFIDITKLDLSIINNRGEK